MNAASIVNSREGVEHIQEALAAAGLDGWLLFEFRGQNWISASLLGVEGTTRRAFVLVPRKGDPKLLVHAIEGTAWRGWAWGTEQEARSQAV